MCIHSVYTYTFSSVYTDIFDYYLYVCILTCMRITILTKKEDRPEVVIDSNNYDISGWLSLQVDGVEVAELHINELYPAIVGFREEYKDHKDA